MILTLTHHVEFTPDSVEPRLEAAVATGLLRAASRDADDRSGAAVRTEAIERGLRVVEGSPELAGSEILLHENGALTTLEVVVPWDRDDAGSPKLWAAVRFASAVAHGIRPAA